LSRLFGRKTEEGKPEESTPDASASWAEGRPDFANAAAAGDIPPAAPSETVASPDAPADLTPPAELAGADLQPVDGAAPENRGAEPTGTSAPAAASPNWWRRLTDGMRRTSSSLSESVTGLFTKRKLDATTLEELEDALVRADLGLDTAVRIAEAVGQGRYDKEIAPDEVKAIMAREIEKVLAPIAKPLVIDRGKKPFVILMIGVNGSGKTTTIGKLAAKFRAEGMAVMLAAGDTFRAAAIEQLRVWGQRTGAPVLAREQGADAAGLAFDALREAREKGMDVLLVDTAGRLQNKTGLMAELEKVVRVMKKLDESAPHAVLLVLDATVGQNAVSQVELFRQTAGVTGLVMTKLDGTARGGILVALAAKFGVPVHFIGVGEAVEDLEPFAARDFARAIAGLEQAA
jgi:fused signal recognition particle receptor